MNIFGNRSIILYCIKYYCFFDNHSVQIYGLPAFEVTYIVSRGALNSTHSLAVHDCHETGIKDFLTAQFVAVSYLQNVYCSICS